MEKLLDSLPGKRSLGISRSLQRIVMLVAHIKTKKKRAHVAHTQLRNSDPLPDGAIETEGRGSLDLRGDSKHIVDWVNGDSKDTGNRKDVTTNTQEHPRSLWRNGNAALSERVGNWMRHVCREHNTRKGREWGKRRVDQQRPRPQSAQRWLRLWCVDHRSHRNKQFPPWRYFVSLHVLSSLPKSEMRGAARTAGEDYWSEGAIVVARYSGLIIKH